MDFVALELIKALQKLDKENTYIVFTNEGPDKTCLSESDNLRIVTFSGSFAFWEQVLLPKEAKKYGCDILHCTSNTAPVFVSMPTVITLHDIIYLENNPLFATGYTSYQRFGNVYRRVVVRANLNRVAKIVTVSQFEKKRLMEFLGLPEKRVDVVYNGVGPHFFVHHSNEELKEISEKYKLPKKYLLFLGNTDPKKNTKNTIVAFARYVKQTKEDVHLVVADLAASLVKEILASKGLEEQLQNIHFTGYIDNKDLPAVIQGAEIFLYPSKRESFGIPILEAMAGTTPVITSNVASMPEVSDGKALLVDPFNVDAIFEGIIKLMGNEEVREKLRNEGEERAAQFKWENSAKQMLEIYKSLLQ